MAPNIPPMAGAFGIISRSIDPRRNGIPLTSDRRVPKSRFVKVQTRPVPDVEVELLKILEVPAEAVGAHLHRDVLAVAGLVGIFGAFAVSVGPD